MFYFTIQSMLLFLSCLSSFFSSPFCSTTFQNFQDAFSHFVWVPRHVSDTASKAVYHGLLKEKFSLLVRNNLFFVKVFVGYQCSDFLDAIRVVSNQASQLQWILLSYDSLINSSIRWVNMNQFQLTNTKYNYCHFY